MTAHTHRAHNHIHMMISSFMRNWQPNSLFTTLHRLIKYRNCMVRSKIVTTDTSDLGRNWEDLAEDTKAFGGLQDPKLRRAPHPS